MVDESDDIILISSDGVIIRIRCEDIRVMGRYAAGVRVMKVSDENKVVSFTRAERDEEAEVEAVEQPTEEEIAEDMKNSEAEEAESEAADLDAIDEEEKIMESLNVKTKAGCAAVMTAASLFRTVGALVYI